jgi:HEAT repeat protein
MTFEELREELNRPLEPARRKTIMQGLVELRDPRAADLFRQELHSDDEDVRTISATGLSSLGTDDAVDAWLAVINDAPDPLHQDVTPAVVALSRLGIRVLPSILPLLESSDASTRQRAQKVLERVTFSDVSDAVQPRPLSQAATTQWTALWERNGSYQWDAPEPQRRAAMARWRQWISERVRVPLSP